MKITVNNQKKSPNKSASATSKKLSREEIAKEKERLLQLEKVYANKIKQLKQTPGDSAVVSPVDDKENKPEIVPHVKKEIPRLEKIAFSTIDLTDEHELDEKPCKRRKSLMELNPSTKPNIEVKAVRLSRSSISSTSGEDKIKVDFPEGKSLIKLHRLQVLTLNSNMLIKLAQLYEPCHEKTCVCHMRTTKHPRSLISTFVVCCLCSIIYLVSTLAIL